MRTTKPLMPHGLMLVAACSIMTGCVDDKYDLSDIDTTSRFTVNNLTVPVNLSEIKLDKVINLDDNENISVIDNKYAISKGGQIEATEFDLGHIHVGAPLINPSQLSVPVPQLPSIPGIEINVPEIQLPSVEYQTYDLELKNVDPSLKKLNNIKTEQPIDVEVTLSVPASIVENGNVITFHNIKIKLPWGLMMSDERYNPETGLFEIKEISVGRDGQAKIKVQASGIELGERGIIENHQLSISGEIGIESGYITGTIRDLTLPNPLIIKVDYKVSEFDIKSFSGKIDYKMDDISIAPISLRDLPDFLNDPQTNIILADPKITVDLTNPVARYGLIGKGRLTLTSQFINGLLKPSYSDVFTLSDRNGNGTSRIVFATEEKPGDTDICLFPGLGYVLTYLPDNPASISEGKGLPLSISVAIEDLSFAGDVTDFPLGNIGSAAGDYSFDAPLGFDFGSTVFYETTENGWSSDDLDKVNIKTIDLTANCTTNLPVSIQLEVVPVDKNGNEISILEENKTFEVPANAPNHPVTLKIKAKEGTTITNFDGMKFKAIIGQHSPWYPDGGGTTEALGPDLQIKLDNLRVTVDGYYETDF